MNIHLLAVEITKKEGKKKSLSIAQVKEVIGLVADEIYLDPELLQKLLALGSKRIKKI